MVNQQKITAPLGGVVCWDEASRAAAGAAGLVALQPGQTLLLAAAELRPDSPRAMALAQACAQRGWEHARRDECAASFGLQDTRTGHAICVRDPAGAQPLYYCHRPGRYLAFACETEPLLALPGMERRLNRLKAALYLSGVASDAFDASMTFFAGVHRLPPGHVLLARPDGVTLRRTARYTADAALAQLNDEELAEVFRARLQAAVRRAAPGAGLLLSGGLKSAALAALAAEDLSGGEKVPCWSFVPSDVPGWTWPDDPRPILHELAQQHPLAVHPLAWDGWGLADEDDAYPDIKQQPIWFYIREEERAALAGAQAAGLTALMTGAGALALPLFRRAAGVAAAALKGGEWRELLFDAELDRRRPAREIARLVKNDLVAPLLPWSWRRASRWFGRPWRPGAQVEHRCMVRESLLRETGAREWVQERAHQLSRDFRENAYAELARGSVQLQLESWALLGRRHGVEFRHPFLDPGVVDFCLGLPAAYFLRGDPQRVLRLALRGRLPEAVRTRCGRQAAISDWPWRKWRKLEAERRRLAVLQTNRALAEFVDLAPIQGALARFPDEATLQRALATGGLVAAARLVNPDGAPTSTEYYRAFARFLTRNGFD